MCPVCRGQEENTSPLELEFPVIVSLMWLLKEQSSFTRRQPRTGVMAQWFEEHTLLSQRT